MSAFEIISPDGEDILIGNEIPAGYQSLLLKGSNSFIADCSFGDLLFTHYPGDGFDIWKSSYLIERKAKVIGRANVPLLELSLMYENSFSINWKGIGAAKLPYKQIEMYHAPYMDNVTTFHPGNFTTVDFHYHRALLDLYVPDFPVLGRFMEKVHKGEGAKLFNRNQFSCPRIDIVVKELMTYNFKDSLAPVYYDSYAHILLVLLLERLSTFNPNSRFFTPSEIEVAHEAKRLLSTEITELFTIKQLSEKLHTNPYKLKTAFKHLFGTSIGRYKKSLLMDQAKFLLQNTTKSLDEIAFMLGYNSQQSFSTAFRNHFKVVPSHYRKRR